MVRAERRGQFPDLHVVALGGCEPDLRGCLVDDRILVPPVALERPWRLRRAVRLGYPLPDPGAEWTSPQCLTILSGVDCAARITSSDEFGGMICRTS